MTEPRVRQSLYEPPRGYGWRARLAWFVLHFGCRHPRGVVCRHRQYEYDFEYHAHLRGMASATQHEHDKRDPFYPWPKEPETTR